MSVCTWLTQEEFGLFGVILVSINYKPKCITISDYCNVKIGKYLDTLFRTNHGYVNIGQ